MNDTMNGLYMLRFMREGISCEAVFKSRGAFDAAYGRAIEDAKAELWHSVTDDFGVSHTLDLSRFFMVAFAFEDIVRRDQALKMGQQGSAMPKGFMPQQ